MEVMTLCSVVAVLRIVPNRSQFFRYDSVTLSCVDQKDPSDWRVKRNTITENNQECSSSWGKRNQSDCFISDVYPSDSGEYWCESGPGMCSNIINITVTDGSVILESPVLPVAEGEAATLRCISKEPSYNLTEFYKDGVLVENSSTGVMTIHQVSKSHEGFYRCNMIGAGESADSWLAVRVERPEAFRSSLTYFLLPALSGCLSLVSMMLLCLKRNLKAPVDRDVFYIDVTFPQEEQPKGLTETTVEPTVYSTIRPRAT